MKHFLKVIVSFIERILMFGIKKDSAIFDAKEFLWVEKLNAKYQIILDEYNTLREKKIMLPAFKDVSQEQISISQHADWRVFFLKIYDNNINENIKLVPKTFEIINSIPNVSTVFFSVLKANSNLTLHRGPYKGVLRGHLPLIVPKGDCGIMVDNKNLEWKIGKTLIFDDTYLHKAWNNTNEDRVVLFFDFKRNLLPPFNYFNNFILYIIKKSTLIKRIRLNLIKEI
jgi:beta-hydroxylase